MSKIAFLYPGQGAQKAGMGQDFYEACQASRDIFDQADQVLDFKVSEMCFAEADDRLNLTEYTQPALVTTCLAMTAAILERGIRPDVTAGLSLGEYAAIAIAGGMTCEEAIRTVRQRGIYMNEAVPAGVGMMMAVIGLSGEQVAEVVDPMEGVSVANYNCPGQVVITGEKAAVMAAGEKLSQIRARVMPLNVSGPFHSPYLQSAGEKLGAVLDQVAWKPLEIPYITNVTADYVRDIQDTKALLMAQVSSSVRWEQTMRQMIADGVDTFVEIGPGKTLAGFMKKIDRKCKVISIGSYSDIDKLQA